ncbi:MAG: hypothetical protein AB7I04_15605 [Pseudomonadales bacterium]
MTDPSTSWIIGLIGLGLLAAAFPYVTRYRHPEQRVFAAYLLFVSVFLTVAIVLYALLSWLLSVLDLAGLLQHPGVALLYLAFIFLPAVALAAWQARKPPIRRSPP